MRYQVRGIPTLLLFKGGQLVASKVGATGKADLQKMIDNTSKRGTAEPGAYAAFRIRDYRYLLAGTVLSVFGLQASSGSGQLGSLHQTHSALVLGNVGFVQVAPFFLFSLFAGHVADRQDRRSIIILIQLVYLAAAFLLLFAGRSVAAFTFRCSWALPPEPSRDRRAVRSSRAGPKEVLSNAITWRASGQEIANVGGPALAGLLLATLGSRSVYIFQVCCALLTLLFFTLMRRQDFERATARGAGTLLEGLRFVLSHRLILPAISLDLFGVLFGGAVALLPIFAVDILHAGPKALGWLRAAPSVGAVLMAVTLAHIGRIQTRGPRDDLAVDRLRPRDHRVRAVAQPLACLWRCWCW